MAKGEKTEPMDGNEPDSPNIYGRNGNGQFRPKDEGDLRDGKGRFAKGRKPGPGRTRAIVKANHLETWRATVTPAELGEVIVAILNQAKRGSIESAKLILSRCVPEETLLRVATEGEVRFAGIDPGELDRKMLAELFAAIEKQRNYHAQVAAEEAARLAASDTEPYEARAEVYEDLENPEKAAADREVAARRDLGAP